MTTPPSMQLPGSFATPSPAPVYVDGVAIRPLGPVVVPAGSKPNPGGPSIAPGGTQTKPAQGFWSTQLRPAGDPTFEQLTISLAQARLISYITLDISHFPLSATLWWWDGDAWDQVAHPNGTPLEWLMTASVPAVVDNPAALNAGQNPYHYGNGHWFHHDNKIFPVTTARLLIRMQRLAQTSGHQKFPVSPQGKPVPYPLGIRNLDFGMRLLSCADAPYALRDPQVLSLRQPFTTSSDVKGSPVQVAIRENRASDLLRGPS